MSNDYEGMVKAAEAATVEVLYRYSLHVPEPFRAEYYANVRGIGSEMLRESTQPIDIESLCRAVACAVNEAHERPARLGFWRRFRDGVLSWMSGRVD